MTGAEQQLPASVRTRSGTNGFGRAVHYYFNYSGEEVSFGYPRKAGTSLLAGRRVAPAEKLTLAPWDVAIIEEDGK